MKEDSFIEIPDLNGNIITCDKNFCEFVMTFKIKGDQENQ